MSFLKFILRRLAAIPITLLVITAVSLRYRHAGAGRRTGQPSTGRHAHAPP